MTSRRLIFGFGTFIGGGAGAAKLFCSVDIPRGRRRDRFVAADIESSKNSTIGVGTHNIMDGIKLQGLLKHYASASRVEGLNIVCVQEDVQEVCTSQILANAMGSYYSVDVRKNAPRLATIYDSERLVLKRSFTLKLPRLEHRSLADRLMFGGGETEEKYALVSVFEDRSYAHESQSQGDTTSNDGTRECSIGRGGPCEIIVANIHLDALGDNSHRKKQITAVADFFENTFYDTSNDKRPLLVLCGDTNVFEVGSRRSQAVALERVLEPLEAIGIHAAAYPAESSENESDLPRRPDTHFFSRADEPKFAHQLGVFVGEVFGLDMPRCYDIISTNGAVLGFGQIETLESDHDFVFAVISTKRDN